MTREEVIREACEIVGLAYISVGDFISSSDGFCDKRPERRGPFWDYRNEGQVLEFVRQAVLEKLRREGHAVE